MNDEKTMYPSHHLCVLCGVTFTDYFKETDWCFACAQEIIEMKKKPTQRVICKQCEKPFETKYSRKIFCCRICASAWHNYVNKYMMDEYKKMTNKEENSD